MAAVPWLCCRSLIAKPGKVGYYRQFIVTIFISSPCNITLRGNYNLLHLRKLWEQLTDPWHSNIWPQYIWQLKWALKANIAHCVVVLVSLCGSQGPPNALWVMPGDVTHCIEKIYKSECIVLLITDNNHSRLKLVFKE